jgi:hypothetical protein
MYQEKSGNLGHYHAMKFLGIFTRGHFKTDNFLLTAYYCAQRLLKTRVHFLKRFIYFCNSFSILEKDFYIFANPFFPPKLSSSIMHTGVM